MKKYVFFKLFGLATLAMMTLVIISILEVVVYSYIVNPGKGEAVYKAHAEFSAPFISGIFGFIVFFLVTRYWKKRNYENLPKLVFLFPLTYVLLDILVLLLEGSVQWSGFILIFIIANGAKFLGSYLGYKSTDWQRSTTKSNLRTANFCLATKEPVTRFSVFFAINGWIWAESGACQDIVSHT